MAFACDVHEQTPAAILITVCQTGDVLASCQECMAGAGLMLIGSVAGEDAVKRVTAALYADEADGHDAGTDDEAPEGAPASEPAAAPAESPEPVSEPEAPDEAIPAESDPGQGDPAPDGQLAQPVTTG